MLLDCSGKASAIRLLKDCINTCLDADRGLLQSAGFGCTLIRIRLSKSRRPGLVSFDSTADNFQIGFFWARLGCCVVVVQPMGQGAVPVLLDVAFVQSMALPGMALHLAPSQWLTAKAFDSSSAPVRSLSALRNWRCQ